MKAIVYGAGSIGRGFIGQIFGESGYEVVFVDIDNTLIDRINSARQYPIRFVSEKHVKEIVVKNVRGISANDTKAIAQEIATCDIMATAVGKRQLEKITANIANGLRKRWNSGNKAYLNIIVCENMIHANRYFRSLLEKELNEDELKIFNALVGTVETCVGRNVPVMNEELMDGNPLRIVGEDFTRLPVCAADFKGNIPDIKYMEAYENFEYHIQKKLYLYNMAHALVSYLGYLHDFIYLADAVKEPDIKYIALCALIESSRAMSIEHGVSLDSLIKFSYELIYRFGNSALGITIERTGMDPIRKLSPDDRLIGIASLCMKQSIFPAYISIGIAAGYAYCNENDNASVTINNYIKENGIEKAIEKFSGLDARCPLSEHIVKMYDLLQKADYKTIIEAAQQKSFIYENMTDGGNSLD